MNRVITIVALLVLSTLAAGCIGRVPFTHDLKTRYSLDKEQVKNLQFFISHLVMLERKLEATDTVVSKDHKLVMRSGSKVEQIFILGGTPGVVVDMDDQTIKVSFEAGSNLVFTTQPQSGGKYMMECVHPGCTVNLHTDKGPVPFQAVGESKAAFLMIDQAHVDRMQGKVSLQKGRTLK